MDVEVQQADPASEHPVPEAVAVGDGQGAEHAEQVEQQGAEATGAEMGAAVAAAAAAAAAAAQVAALPVELAGQLASLDIPQLVDYSGVSAGQPNLMPAITTLIMHITQHLSSPHGNPQLALTFQPLVSMALQMQLQASVPDMSAMAYLPASLASGAGGMPAAAALPAFDPHVLMASATAAAAAAASDAQQQQAAAQQQQQQQASSRGAGSGSRRRQLVGEGEEGEDDTDWRQPWHHKKAQASSSLRPQRHRKKSKLLQEYYDEEGLEQAAARG